MCVYASGQFTETETLFIEAGVNTHINTRHTHAHISLRQKE